MNFFATKGGPRTPNGGAATPIVSLMPITLFLGSHHRGKCPARGVGDQHVEELKDPGGDRQGEAGFPATVSVVSSAVALRPVTR